MFVLFPQLDCETPTGNMQKLTKSLKLSNRVWRVWSFRESPDCHWGLINSTDHLSQLRCLISCKEQTISRKSEVGRLEEANTPMAGGTQWRVTETVAAKEKQKLPCCCVRNVNLVPQGKLTWCSIFFFKRWGEIHSITRQSRCSNRLGKLTPFYRKGESSV